MKGTWVRMTVGDYLKKVPCTIGSVGISWQQDYPWEIKQNPDKEKDVYILPHVLDINLAATIDHDFVPQTGLIPFVGPRDESKFIDFKDGEPEEVPSEAAKKFAAQLKRIENEQSFQAQSFDLSQFT